MKTFYQWMKDRYEYEELKDIANYGCVNGFSGLIYYSETVALYEQFKDELHEKLGSWIEEIGETPKFITDHLGWYDGFANALVWFVAEQYANEIYETMECEEASLTDED